MEEGRECDCFKSFKKGSPITSKFPPILHGSCFGSSYNWDNKICHLNLEAINKILQPILIVESFKLSVWGGNNVINVGFVNYSKHTSFER